MEKCDGYETMSQKIGEQCLSRQMGLIANLSGVGGCVSSYNTWSLIRTSPLTTSKRDGDAGAKPRPEPNDEPWYLETTMLCITGFLYIKCIRHRLVGLVF
jgi:hypothetical protein